MKNRLSLFISILVVVSFMITRISYADERPAFLFLALYKITIGTIKNGIGLTEGKYILNFSMRLMEIAFLSIGLILTAGVRKPLLNVVFGTLYLTYGIMIACLYHSTMNVNLYVVSSIPFYMLSIVLIVNNILTMKA